MRSFLVLKGDIVSLVPVLFKQLFLKSCYVIDCPIFLDNEGVVNLGCNNYMFKFCCESWYKIIIDNSELIIYSKM
jgi:hypothetical protein